MECSIVVRLHPQPKIWPIRWSDGGKTNPPFLCFGDGEKKKFRGRSHQRVRGNNMVVKTKTKEEEQEDEEKEGEDEDGEEEDDEEGQEREEDEKDDDEDEALNRLSYPTYVGIQYWQKIVLIRNQYILHTYITT